MNIEQATSIVIQIGGAAFLLGLLYGLQTLMYGFSADERKEMERANAARRDVKQEQMDFLSRKNVEGAPLFSADFEFIEKALMKDVRTKVGGHAIPKALEPYFIVENTTACSIGSRAEPDVRLDRLVLTLQKESV